MASAPRLNRAATSPRRGVPIPRITDDRPRPPLSLPPWRSSPGGRACRAPPSIGIGEQKPGMFEDPRWQRLGLRDARYIAPWDALRDQRQREKLDTWMEAARARRQPRAARLRALAALRRLARTLPADGQFAREFRRFRARYPDVRDWIVWNEANHPFSLTANRPRRAARYFGIVARNCRGCRVVAADVLDVSGMTAWVRRFQRARPDASADLGDPQLRRHEPAASSPARGRCSRSRRGQVWFTETGGLVVRREYAGHDGHARVPLLAAPRGAGDAPRAAARLPEPADPARLPVPLAGAATA